MSFDASRFSFDPWKDFTGVVMQQGRVQLDSDWNEWLAILNRRIRAGTMDTIGRAVYPITTPYAFKINATQSAGKNAITIGAGRMYVDGLLVENHGAPSSAQFDPALAELSGAPQLVPSAAETDVSFTDQPYLPAAKLPTDNGPFLIFLDVWEREVTALKDPDLIERAVGVDTTGRRQTVWQVRFQDVSKVQGGVTCTSTAPWNTITKPTPSRLTTGVAQSSVGGPCCLTPNTGYTGIENQLYRVEIHQGGKANTSGKVTGATFKWSRDNGSVATAVTKIDAAGSASRLTVVSTGKDQVLGFRPGDWVEVTDDVRELTGKSGDLLQIAVDGVDQTGKTILLSAAVSADVVGNLTSPPSNYPNCHTRVRRWDQGGKIYQTDGTNTTLWVDLNAAGARGDIAVPPAGTRLILENGVTVAFDLATAGEPFRVGDFWSFAARATDGWVEPLAKAPPLGVHHHYARLAVVTFGSQPSDCRIPWPPATTAGESCACTVCVEVADLAADKSAIDKAIAQVNEQGGGRVCLGPGTFALAGNPVRLGNVDEVILSGQGPATVLSYNGTGPALIIDNCREVRIEDLAVSALPDGQVGGVDQQVTIGILVRGDSNAVSVERCIVQVPTQFGLISLKTLGLPDKLLPPDASLKSDIAAANGIAIALDGGKIVSPVFRGNILAADAGIATLGSLPAAKIKKSVEEGPPPPARLLAACRIEGNFMICPQAGVLFGNLPPGQQGAETWYLYALESLIEGNTVLGGAVAGMLLEGQTIQGASVRISQNDLEVANIGIQTGLDGVLIADNTITQGDYAAKLKPAPTSTGIKVMSPNSERLAALTDVRVDRNRVDGVAGPGIYVNATAATICVADNTVRNVSGVGILGRNDLTGAEMIIRGNAVEKVSGPIDPIVKDSLVGIFAQAANTTIRENSVGTIADDQNIRTTKGIFAGATTTSISDNRIHDIGIGMPDHHYYGIDAKLIARGALTVSTNTIEAAWANAPSARWYVFGINVVGPESQTVCVQQNVIDVSLQLGWFINIDAAKADCVVTGNCCRAE
jgi:hypothetical protein